ncbi:MAG: hypothetical protein H6839_12605 [Planctomycetes bacterium]|nr:hypothetical protein [Planctomycetota bacterium]
MQHSCDNCGASLAIDEDSPHFVSCIHCGTLHYAAEVISRLRKQKFTPPPVMLPERYSIAPYKGGVVISRKWSQTLVLAFAPLFVLFLGSLFLVLKGDSHGGSFAAALLQTVVMGGIAIYGMMACLFNHKNYFVTRRGIRITDGPFPVQPARLIPHSQIEVCFAWGQEMFGGGRMYMTVIRLFGGKLMYIFSGPDAADEAWFLAYYLNTASGVAQRRRRELREYAARRKHELQLLKRDARRGSAQAREALGLAASFGGPVTRILLGGKKKAKPPQPRAYELACRRCGAPTTDDDIHTFERYSLCSYCGTLEDISEFLSSPRVRLPGLPHNHPSWEFDGGVRQLAISPRRDWFPFLVLIAGLVLSGIALAGAPFVEAKTVKVPLYLLGILPVPPLLGGLMYHGYKLAARGRSVVDAERVRRWDHALAHKPDVDVPAGEVVQVFSGTAHFANERNRRVPGYEVSIVDRSSRKFVIVNRLRTPQEALAIELRMETILGIEDVPVKRPV